MSPWISFAGVACVSFLLGFWCSDVAHRAERRTAVVVVERCSPRVGCP